MSAGQPTTEKKPLLQSYGTFFTGLFSGIVAACALIYSIFHNWPAPQVHPLRVTAESQTSVVYTVEKPITQQQLAVRIINTSARPVDSIEITTPLRQANFTEAYTADEPQRLGIKNNACIIGTLAIEQEETYYININEGKVDTLIIAYGDKTDGDKIAVPVQIPQIVESPTMLRSIAAFAAVCIGVALMTWITRWKRDKKIESKLDQIIEDRSRKRWVPRISLKPGVREKIDSIMSIAEDNEWRIPNEISDNQNSQSSTNCLHVHSSQTRWGGGT